MSLNHPKRRAIPLLCRKIALRMLLTSATANILLGVPLVAFGNFGWRFSMSTLPLTLIVCPVTPLLMILHHTIRLWPRRHWLVVCEVISSLAEAIIVGAILLPGVSLALQEARHGDLGSIITVLYGVASLTLSASSLVAFIFLLFDLFNKRGRNVLRQYDFFSGLCRPGRQWSFIWGSSTTRKRFSTDNIFIRCIRGGLAIICLVGILSLVFYAAIWQPLQWSAHPGAKISRVPVLEGNVYGKLASIIGWWGFQWWVILTVPDALASYQYYPTVTISQNSLDTNLFGEISCQSQGRIRPQSILVECLSEMLPSTYTQFFEPLIVINFPEAPYNLTGEPYNFELRLGSWGSTVDEILMHADPVILGPGSNLHGLSVISVKERFSGEKTAILGMPQYHHFPIVNVHALSPDWLPSLPRDNYTATLRVTIRSQPYIEIEKEYLEGSVLNGFALVGGVWTLVNGVFAAIFGSTLLLVLFGIKPLSIYGLVHLFRPGRGSLVDADYVLSPEERDRIVGILRGHLLDVDDVEGDGASSTHYNRTSILPPSDRPQCDAGTNV